MTKRGDADMRIKHAKTFRSYIAVGLLALTTACAATYSNHGYVPSDVELENVLVGSDTRGTVEDVIGRPSSTGVLSDSAWYYISSKVKYFTYHKPEMIERTILAISFDANDTVTNIERFGLEDGRVITLTRRTTSASVKGTTFFRQLVNNLGNFTPGQFLEDG